MSMLSPYDWSTTASSNTDLGGGTVANSQMYPSGVDNAFREMMAEIARMLDSLGGVNTVGGTASAITVTIGEDWSAYATGQLLAVKASSASTGATTLNVTPKSGSALGAKAIRRQGDSAIQANDMRANGVYLLRYDASYNSAAGAWVLLNPAPVWSALTGTPTTLSGYGITDAISATSGNPAIPGALYGLTLSNDGTTPASKIDIAAGQAASDDTIPTLMILGSALIKDISSSWSVGSGNGSLDTGTVANGTYHVYLIMRPDTGVVDVLTSTSASSPTMPANYTKKRRIGSIIRSGGNIVKFAQFGDLFIRDVAASDANATNPGTSRVTVTLSVPVGIVVSALVVGYIFNSATAAARSLLFTSPSQTDTTPTNALFNARTEASTGLNSIGSAQVLTNTSAQICYRLDVSDSNTVAKVETMGWIDTRGRF